MTTASWKATVYRQTSNVSRTLVGNRIVDHSDVIGALLQLHHHFRLNAWLQWIGQTQLQDETGNIYVLIICAIYIRGLTIVTFHSTPRWKEPTRAVEAHPRNSVSVNGILWDPCTISWMYHEILMVQFQDSGDEFRAIIDKYMKCMITPSEWTNVCR